MKILTAAFFIVISQACFSQIEVREVAKTTVIGKVKSGGNFIAELNYKIVDGDTLYTIMYNNAEYTRLTDIQSISFNSDDNTLEKLYKTMKGVFSEENKKNKEYKVALILGGNHVSLMNMRMLGITSVMVSPERGYFTLTEKQVDRLFGKSK